MSGRQGQSLRGLLIAALLGLLAGCGNGGDGELGRYADEALWLCKPGIALDRCLELDQTTTYVYEDGNTAVFEHEPVVDAEFDCFYVYPTVDLRPEPGNTLDLSDDTSLVRPLYNQAARFTELCEMYAPKYRQMTIGSYSVENPFGSGYFSLGYSDIEAAFDQYLLENPERNFVLIGHSQGAHVLLRLLQERFDNDNDEDLRSRMISALVIGSLGAYQVPEGELTGGSLQNIPLCTQATDTGCVVAYDTVAAGDSEQRPELEQPRVCVNPTALGGEPGIAATTIYNRDEGIPFPAGVETDWIAYPGLYSANCESDGSLGADVAPGRSTPFTPQLIQVFLGSTPASLHLADYNFGMGDLLRIVEVQAANH
ncbi:DUF3089 domain-containing protein [Candidatus Litorirhabdus singularis]|uniref:DUF3089 domain-containing protein n=1 Tax=Candidatus Litorirhabdus singularis TaxID=2518993 RepID=UPI00242C3BDC|nr:DUF3089 domain-containing protein [Candidatus Litorirhabdus singularis]